MRPFESNAARRNCEVLSFLPSQRRPSPSMGWFGFRIYSFRGLHHVHPKVSACIIAKLPKWQPSTPDTSAEFVTSPHRLIANRPSRPDRMGLSPIRSPTPFQGVLNLPKIAAHILRMSLVIVKHFVTNEHRRRGDESWQRPLPCSRLQGRGP